MTLSGNQDHHNNTWLGISIETSGELTKSHLSRLHDFVYQSLRTDHTALTANMQREWSTHQM